MVKNMVESTKKAKDNQEYCQKYGQRFCSIAMSLYIINVWWVEQMVMNVV